ncbi:MAG: hypothetical protein LE169_04680 [Endomicrobium sp.]|nr:hypothetical protein [Endomicrobium sp.]
MKKAIPLFLIVVLISGCGKPLNNAKSEVANTVAQKPEQINSMPIPTPVPSPTLTPSPLVMPVPSESSSLFWLFWSCKWVCKIVGGIVGGLVALFVFSSAVGYFLLNCTDTHNPS